MTNLFFYGSLRDEALLRIVLGDPDANIRLIPAALPDHQVSRVQDQHFPMIHAQAESQAAGLLALELTDAQIDRLNFYEGGFAYDLKDMRVTSDGSEHPAKVYFPQEGKYQPAEPWSLEVWQRDWGPLSYLTAQDAMALFGQITTQQLHARFPRLRALADTRLRAQNAANRTMRAGFSEGQVQVDTRTRRHDGFYKLDELHLRHPKFDGTKSDLLVREVFISADATIVLPYDPKTDQILLVEQFRMGPTGRGDPFPWCLEPVAGFVDAGETPEQTAYRETEEEAGLTLNALELVTRGYTSPGASSEYFHMYVGLCDLSEKRRETSGLDTEGEDIRSHVLTFDDAMALVDKGEINVLPTILCLNWLARHRDRLRAGS